MGIEKSACRVKKRGDNWNNVTSSSKNCSSFTHSASTTALCKHLIGNRLHISIKDWCLHLLVIITSQILIIQYFLAVTFPPLSPLLSSTHSSIYTQHIIILEILLGQQEEEIKDTTIREKHKVRWLPSPQNSLRICKKFCIYPISNAAWSHY